MRPLNNCVVVVTGGSRGIGRAIVCELARQGARVVFTFAREQAKAQALVEQLKQEGAEVLGLQADVRDAKRAQQVIGEAIERFGGVDALVNNAGIIRDKALMFMEPSDWQEVLDTNLTGVFNFCRAAIITFLKQRHGRIVNITSVAGLLGAARQVNYAASKAGLIGLTKALAKEVASYNVNVNAVAPGYIETDMTAMIEGKHLAELQKQIPLGRFGRSEEVAKLVAALLGDIGAYITGQIFVIDGGLTLG